MESSSTNSSVTSGFEFAVIDARAMKANPWAVGASVFLNGILLALLLYIGAGRRAYYDPHLGEAAPLNIDDLRLLVWRAAHIGGGGGGTRSPIDPVAGRLPKFENNPIVAPQVPVLDRPKLAVDPSLKALPDIKIPEDVAVVNIGGPRSPNVTLSSNGPGRSGGIGTGSDGGDGPGRGDGAGPGFKGGIGVYGPGSGVKPPTVISAPSAEFSDEARRSKFQGICLISLVVDAQGNPQNIRVVRPLGMGLDEKALEAVAKYKFKPATLNGKPVAAMVTVEVNFRLF